MNELLEARDEKRLLRLQKQLAKQDLLIGDELGYVPLSKTGAELLFEIVSQRYEQASTLVTSREAKAGSAHRTQARRCASTGQGTRRSRHPVAQRPFRK